jgi:16S rRNA (uracil1498-N3)-methyltransferase
VTGQARQAAAQVFVSDLERVELVDEDRHHLVRVLRLRAGEQVVASDGRGSFRICRFGGDRIEVEGPLVHVERPEPAVTVGFVPTARADDVVQKLTEAGVDRIVVLRSDRSVVRWSGAKAEAALDRLRRVARAAAAQSRRPWLPEVEGVLGLHELGRPLIAVPDGPMRLVVDHPVIAVGPEGGWSERELEAFGPGVNLGAWIYRAETAAVAAGVLLCTLRSGLVLPAIERLG